MYAASMTIFAVAGTIATAASAASPVSLISDVKVERTVTTGGRSRTVVEDPKTVLPGDRLVFSTRFRNGGSMVVNQVAVLNPLPSGVVWSGDGSPGALVSIDGGRTFGRLAELRVGTGSVSRAARPGDVTHLKWIIPAIQPGTAGTLQYRATVR